MQLFLGKSATILLRGRHVVPRKLIALGYRFSYPTLRDALTDLVGAAEQSMAA
jgi:NAD dependent epimerase/dehydratase family enzyme